jgi:hypothetical protein
MINSYKKQDSAYNQAPVKIIGFVPYDRMQKIYAKLIQHKNIFVQPTAMRFYPMDFSASHVIGYVGSADKKEFLDIYVAPCSASYSEPIIDGAQCKRAEYIVSYKPSGYKDFENSMKLTPSSPALMYSANNKLYTKAIYKIKIVYSE